MRKTLYVVAAGLVVPAVAEVGSTNSVSPNAATQRLQEVVVTATRTEELPGDVPFATKTVPRLSVRNEQMAATMPEVLLETPGVLVQQTGHGQGSPFLRGFTGFRTLALVDGIRLNNSTFREGPNQYWSTVDAMAVDRLEVVCGAGGVMYGSDAVGGVVNAMMHRPKFGDDEGWLWNAGALYRVSSAESSHAGRVEGSGAHREFAGFSVGLSGMTLGNVEGGRDVGEQPYTDYDQFSGDARVDYFLSAKTRLTVAFQRTQQEDVKRTHRTIYGLTWRGLSRGSDLQHSFDQLRELAYARLQHATARGDQFMATTSWQRQDEFQLVQRANGTYQHSYTDVRTLGLSLQGTSPSPIGEWTYGIEEYRDFVDAAQLNYDAAGAFTSAAIQGPVADNSTYDLAGIFAQDDVPLPGRVHVIVGGRFTWARADAGILRDPATATARSFEDDWLNLSGQARALWHPDEAERWSVWTGVAQGFRAPNFSDLTRFDIARSGELETAALDLKPEDFISFDIGARTTQDRWEAGLSLYHTMIEDLIVRTPTGATVGGLLEVTKRNGAEGWVHGVEFDGRLLLPEGFSLFGSVAWQEGKADTYPTSNAASVRAPMTRMHPLTGLAGLRWEAPQRNYFAEAFGIAAAKQDRLSPDDARDTQRIPPGGTPGFATLNLRAGYNWKHHVRAVAALENVLDEDYRIHGSGYNQPGRNFKFSLEVAY